MASINDWAAAAARRIKGERSEERIAAIIETFAKPLLDLLRELRPCHSVDCPNGIDEDEPCSCGAAALNRRIDAALAAPDPERASTSTRQGRRPRSG